MCPSCAYRDALLGSVELIADPADMAADFQAMMQNAMSRGVADAKLKVWAPQGPSCCSSGRSRPPSRT